MAAKPHTVRTCFSPAVYGPVRSRRLGYSLGVNLSPLTRKVCSFDCVYCECGRPSPGPQPSASAHDLLSPGVLEREVSRCFRWHADSRTPINYISFVGSGEPTLYPCFEDAVGIVLRNRDRYLPGIPTSVFTNATGLDRPSALECLYRFDRRFVKLDAGDPETFGRVNNPLPEWCFDDILRRLSSLRNIEISTAVLDGTFRNIESLMSEGFVSHIEAIGPIRVFIYPIDRPSAYPGLVLVPWSVLREVRDFLQSHLMAPVTALPPRRGRPSWFDEAYAGEAPVAAPTVYGTSRADAPPIEVKGTMTW